MNQSNCIMLYAGKVIDETGLMKQRLTKHYLPVLAIVITAMFFFFIFRGKRDSITFIAWSTGYISLVILAISLITGPVNLMMKHKNPLSTYFRRDIGISGGILALIHSVSGLFVHLRGRMWLYFLNENNRIRIDNFGFANYTGVLAALIIILLLVTSNDYLLKKLNSHIWKNIQRSSYLMIILTSLHIYFYTIGRDNLNIFLWFYIPLFLLILILQLTGIYLFRSAGSSKGGKALG
jgi:methionine sulfoxide reductase heme-binding subunit